MSMIVTGSIGAGISLASSVFGFASASKARRRAEGEKRKQLAKLDQLEKNRQAIINPYANVKNLSSMAKDLSYLADKLSNPYASLGVATNAAKFEAEQIDLSLANTLDTLRETGASAGGATALAQAALKAKQGISSSLEQQEANNDKLRAQGQAELQQQKLNVQLSEGQRMQGIQLSEAERIQNADVAGKQFVFNATENRQQQEIDRTAGLAGIAGQQAAQSRADQTGAITSGLSALGSIAQSTGTGYAAWKKG